MDPTRFAVGQLEPARVPRLTSHPPACVATGDSPNLVLKHLSLEYNVTVKIEFVYPRLHAQTRYN